MTLRILNVIRFPIGGIRSYLRYTYSRLPADRYSTTIVTVDMPEARLLPEGMAPLAVDLRLVPERGALLGLVREMNRALAVRSYDIVHSQGTTAAIASWPAARLRRVPHIVTLHETFRAEQFAGPQGALKRRVLQRVFSSVDAVVCVSGDARENLLKHIPLADSAIRRVHVIRNGVAIDTLMSEAVASATDVRAVHALNPETITLGYVGRFMPEKGFDVLLQAVRSLSQDGAGLPHFVIVAVNDGAFLREYRQQIADWGIERFFVFTGFRSSVAGILSGLDGVVVPSRREACPLVAMEAMVLGCPLIASDCLGLRELTAGSPATTAIAGSPDSLALAIAQFLRNHSEAKARAQAYAASAQSRFDAARTSDSLIALFGAALANRHVPMAVARG